MKINVILAGIAMSLLLLALPAAASDYTLGVFGNANEDEVINMQDVTYTELIILEYRDKADGSSRKDRYPHKCLQPKSFNIDPETLCLLISKSKSSKLPGIPEK